MKKISTLITIIVSFLSCLVISFGYAKLTDNFRISAEIKSQVQEGVFICDATSNDNIVINSYVSSTVNSSTTLGNQNKAEATMTITVFNNGKETYGYNAIKYMVGESTYSNEDIIVEVDIDRRTEIKVNSYLTFNAIFSYKNDKVSSNKVLNSILNFEFLPLDQIPEDEEEIAVNGALERFTEILNNPAETKQLTDQMDKSNENDRHNNSYIGNVVGASEKDIELLKELFVGNLHININGIDTQVTLIIKRENLDNNKNTGDENGNEMTIYMTTDDLQRDSWLSAGKAPVFAAIFSKNNSDGGWAQIGSMVEGTATIKGYSGSVLGEGSFDTDTWKSKSNQTIEQVLASFK